MSSVDQLYDLAEADVRAATRAYLKSRNAPAFERAMERALAKAHTAASIRGTADRTGVMPKGLSRAEREDIKAKVKDQIDYLHGFIGAAPYLSDAEVAQRAALYVGSVRSSFYSGRFPGLPGYPGDGGTPCLGNCQCMLEEREGGIWWVLGAAEHCAGCVARAGGSPYGK